MTSTLSFGIDFKVGPYISKLAERSRKTSRIILHSGNHLAGWPMSFQFYATAWTLDWNGSTISFLQECLQLVSNHPLNLLAQEWNVGNVPILLRSSIAGLLWNGQKPSLWLFHRGMYIMWVAHSAVCSFPNFKSDDGQGSKKEEVALWHAIALSTSSGHTIRN